MPGTVKSELLSDADGSCRYYQTNVTVNKKIAGYILLDNGHFITVKKEPSPTDSFRKDASRHLLFIRIA